MRSVSVWIVVGTLGFCWLAQAPAAYAQQKEAPKPLLVDPNAPPPPSLNVKEKDKQKVVDPHALPSELVDERQKNRDAFKEWRKDDTAIRKACNDVHTLKERQDCIAKEDASDRRRKAVHDKMIATLKKIDAWRRKDRGLPPSPWSAPEEVAKFKKQNPNVDLQTGRIVNKPPGSPGGPPKQSTTLLPSNPKPLPAGTF